MTVKQVMAWMQEQAPFDSAEPFDNVGLLIGNENAEVHSVLFGMDLTEAMLRETEAYGADLIITHHPMLFHAFKRIDYRAPQGKLLQAVLTRRINVIAAHTNWDKAEGGVSDALAEALELQNVHALDEYLRIGQLAAPASVQQFSKMVESALSFAPRVYGSKQSIQTVAVAGGAYGEGEALAAESGADAFVVGEIRHHEILDACARGLLVLDAGHFATEFPGINKLFRRFSAAAQTESWPVQVFMHRQVPFEGAFTYTD